jgi:hypothetical protein
LDLFCFCVACLLDALGDLSPMMFVFRLMVHSPAALWVAPKGGLPYLFLEGLANLYFHSVITVVVQQGDDIAGERLTVEG